MRWAGLIIIPVALALVSVKTASAELLYETISDIQVPTSVTWGTQVEWQGHIVYEVKDVGPTYQVKVARDGEPHQYPYFYVSFSKQWEYLGTTRHVNPEAERKAAEDKARAEQEAKRKAEEDARRAQEDQDRQRREREEREREERERPPVVKPPEEEPEPEEPDPEEPEE